MTSKKVIASIPKAAKNDFPENISLIPGRSIIHKILNRVFIADLLLFV